MASGSSCSLQGNTPTQVWDRNTAGYGYSREKREQKLPLVWSSLGHLKVYTPQRTDPGTALITFQTFPVVRPKQDSCSHLPHTLTRSTCDRSKALQALHTSTTQTLRQEQNPKTQSQGFVTTEARDGSPFQGWGTIFGKTKSNFLGCREGRAG